MPQISLEASHLHVHRTLDQLDAKLPSKGYSLSEVAADDKLLFEGRQKVDFKQHTTSELINDLTLIEYLLDSVRPAYQQLCGFNRPDNEDQTIEPPESFEDELFLANLEYMLLCLQGQVLYTLFIGHTSAEILRHVVECQKEQDRNDKHWFSEFPDARHPLSTTWPWSIRPSLAVIWGVCWMFYDHDLVHDLVEWDNDRNMRDTTTGEVLLTWEDLRGLPPSSLFPGKLNFSGFRLFRCFSRPRVKTVLGPALSEEGRLRKVDW